LLRVGDPLVSGRHLERADARGLHPLDTMLSFFNWEAGQLRTCMADDPLGNASRYTGVAARLGTWEEEGESRAGSRAGVMRQTTVRLAAKRMP